MKTGLPAICFCLFLVSCGGDATVNQSVESVPFSAIALSEFVEATKDKYDLPGLGVLIQVGDEKPMIAVSGVRKRGRDEPIGASDMWFIGSTAKPMTATLLATFVQDGLVSFESTLFEVFPEYAEHFTDDTKQITVSHILSHAAGLPPNPADSPSELAKILGETDDVAEQRKIILTKAMSGELLFAPGSDYAYSNTGYILAGAVIERVGGKDFETLLAARVLQPLGISEFGFGQPGDRSRANSIDQPWGHRPSFFTLIPVAPADVEHVNPALFNSAGNLYISLTDWAKFVRDQLKGRKGRGVLVGQAFYESLQMPISGETGYARGWGVLVEEGLPVMLTHNGGDGNWYADVRAYPATDLILLVATNDGRDEGEAKSAVDEIRRSFNSRNSPVP